jgi:hypothetical protein
MATVSQQQHKWASLRDSLVPNNIQQSFCPEPSRSETVAWCLPSGEARCATQHADIGKELRMHLP